MLNYLIPSGIASIAFTEVTTYYTISGEMCYNEIGFVESYDISGEMMVNLKLLSSPTVECDYWYYENKLGSNHTIHEEDETILLVNRKQWDGNYTSFYIEFPTQSKIPIHNSYENVEASYMGKKYVFWNNQYISTYYYCFSVSELQNVLRCEWFFEETTGVLLRFIKSIEINFVRVQWVEYMVKNTTISLSGVHPITALFTNFRECFVGVGGAAVIIIFLFYYLIREKSQRGVVD